MSTNSSTYSKDSCLHLQLSSISYSFPLELNCFIPKPDCLILTMFTITTTTLLLLPLCVLVLHHGLQRWQKQRSFFTAATTSHSDSFTYHLVTMELLKVFGSVLRCIIIYKNDYTMVTVWFYVLAINWYGETFFHVLTCVEHYLAAVHPLTYINLRTTRWIRIRNVIIGCIWLLCFGLTSLVTIGDNYLIMNVCLLLSCVIIISFCSLSVLSALIRPSPGEKDRGRISVDQSKQRAFYITVTILGALLLKCTWNMFWSLQSVLNGWITECALDTSGSWLSFPGSLVLPLLYLHKTGMLACCKVNIRRSR